jgi:hypothetical protein
MKRIGVPSPAFSTWSFTPSLVVITDIGKTPQNCGGKSFSVRACATISGSSVQNFSTHDDGTEVLTFTKRSSKRLRK